MNLTESGMVALTRDALTALKGALMRDAGYASAGYLQEAGYAGGAALFDAFRAWLAERGAAEPESLSMGAFQQYAASFFSENGWGTLEIGEMDSVATLDSGDWSEAMPDAGVEHPCCHLSSGMFADFFGRVAGAPLAVMEVECRSTGASRCRFLLGSTEVLQHVYDSMAAGAGYEEGLATV